MPVDQDDIHKLRFSEKASWAQHYSTVRMGLSTFLITLAAMLLATSATAKTPWHASGSLMALVAAITFLLYYSSQMQKMLFEQYECRKILYSAAKMAAPKKPGGVFTWVWVPAYILIPAIVLYFVAFVNYASQVQWWWQ